MTKRVAVIGGGIAGMTFAHTLKDKLGDKVEVTVITKDPFYLTGPSRPLLVTKEQSYDRMIRGYEEAMRKGIKFVFGNVTKVDPANRKVYVNESPTKVPLVKEVEYDYLLVAPGVVYDGSSINGYEQYSYQVANVYEPGRVDVLAERVWTVKEGAVVVYAPPMPYRCAPAPSETTLLIDTVLRHRGVRDKVRVIHVDANDKPQPAPTADIISKIMEERGIELITSKKIVEMNDKEVILDDGEKISYSVLALLEPNRAPDFVVEAFGGPWLEVRGPQNLRNTKYDDVLAAGDVAKLPFPKNQEIAFESAKFAANNVLEEFGVEPEKVKYWFIGWIYVGNPEGKLESLSIQFSLDFSTKPPKATKDPEPKKDYTAQKDRWEQGYLNNLFHPKTF